MNVSGYATAKGKGFLRHHLVFLQAPLVWQQLSGHEINAGNWGTLCVPAGSLVYRVALLAVAGCPVAEQILTLLYMALLCRHPPTQ